MSFLNFKDIGSEEFHYFRIYNLKKEHLANINFNFNWNKYVVEFQKDCYFDDKCLKEILNKLEDLEK